MAEQYIQDLFRAVGYKADRVGDKLKDIINNAMEAFNVNSNLYIRNIKETKQNRDLVGGVKNVLKRYDDHLSQLDEVKKIINKDFMIEFAFKKYKKMLEAQPKDGDLEFATGDEPEAHEAYNRYNPTKEEMESGYKSPEKPKAEGEQTAEEPKPEEKAPEEAPAEEKPAEGDSNTQ